MATCSLSTLAIPRNSRKKKTLPTVPAAGPNGSTAHFQDALDACAYPRKQPSWEKAELIARKYERAAVGGEDVKAVNTVPTVKEAVAAYLGDAA